MYTFHEGEQVVLSDLEGAYIYTISGVGKTVVRLKYWLGDKEMNGGFAPMCACHHPSKCQLDHGHGVKHELPNRPLH